MSTTPSKTDAKNDQLIGNIKETVGNTIGNASLESKGQAQTGSGKIQENTAEIQDYVQTAADKFAGAVEGVHRSLTGGAATKIENTKEGQAQQDSKIQASATSLTGLVQGVADTALGAVQGVYTTLTGSSATPSDAKKDQIVGDVKENVGGAVGDRSLQTEGQAQHGSGQIQDTAAALTGYVQGAADTVQDAYRSLTGHSATAEVESKKEVQGEESVNNSS